VNNRRTAPPSTVIHISQAAIGQWSGVPQVTWPLVV